MGEPTSRADHDSARAFISRLDAQTMQTRYTTENDPRPSPGITQAATRLAQHKRDRTTFDAAWEDVMADVDKSDRMVLRWAKEALRDAYEDRSGGPLASAAVED